MRSYSLYSGSNLEEVEIGMPREDALLSEYLSRAAHTAHATTVITEPRRGGLEMRSRLRPVLGSGQEEPELSPQFHSAQAQGLRRRRLPS